MLLLLPPSAGKATPRRGRPVDLDGLSRPELRPVRERTLAALATLCEGDPAAARAELGLGDGPDADAERARNVHLTSAPSAAASAVYTGVLYDRLGLRDLPTGAKRRAGARVLIFSGLWGVLAPGDRIPGYRCPATARLPGVAPAATRWRDALTAALPADRMAVDLRSGPYRALWRPADAPTVAVFVVRERAGQRSVVSHMAKATRGDIARTLLVGDGARPARDPRTPDELAARLADAGWTVELDPPDRRGDQALTVVERD
ncbi:MAG: peroxide stress protein YaaA [Solirubrobacteraceae bacterium]|nr:peroxide stress protein YaaA [Solirubrobacteraceae bacterium]